MRQCEGGASKISLLGEAGIVMQTQPINDTPTDVQAEIKRLKADLWQRGFYFAAGISLFPIDAALFLAYWNWFVVQLGARSLSYGLAFALWTVWQFLMRPRLPKQRRAGKWPKNTKIAWSFLLEAYTSRLLTLITGVVIHAILLHR